MIRAAEYVGVSSVSIVVSSELALNSAYGNNASSFVLLLLTYDKV
jgi:hypothetical protein